MEALKNIDIKVVKGMNQDMSSQSFDSNTAFELLNLKNQSLESGIQGSLTNEKGTKEVSILINGEQQYDITNNIIGVIQCTQNMAVIFLKNNGCSIYKVEYVGGSSLKGTLLATGNFDFGSYISGIFCYENSELQKVYWVDGKNPLRYINTVSSGNIIQDANYLSTSPEFKVNHKIKVERQSGGGVFQSGTIQYAFTYYMENGPETGIVDITPLYYISEDNRGVPADQPVGCSFKVSIGNPDTTFDYIRLYSIQRTSLNGTPIVKIVKDIKLNKEN